MLLTRALMGLPSSTCMLYIVLYKYSIWIDSIFNSHFLASIQSSRWRAHWRPFGAEHWNTWMQWKTTRLGAIPHQSQVDWLLWIRITINAPPVKPSDERTSSAMSVNWIAVRLSSTKCTLRVVFNRVCFSTMRLNCFWKPNRTCNSCYTIILIPLIKH